MCEFCVYGFIVKVYCEIFFMLNKVQIYTSEMGALVQGGRTFAFHKANQGLILYCSVCLPEVKPEC